MQRNQNNFKYESIVIKSKKVIVILRYEIRGK